MSETCSLHLQVRQPSRGLVSSGAAGHTPSGHDAEYLSTEQCSAVLTSDIACRQHMSLHIVHSMPPCAMLLPDIQLPVQQTVSVHADGHANTDGQPGNCRISTHQGRRPMRVMYSTFSQWMLLHSSSSCDAISMHGEHRLLHAASCVCSASALLQPAKAT